MGRKKDLKLNTQHATEDKEIITEKYKEVRDENGIFNPAGINHEEILHQGISNGKTRFTRKRMRNDLPFTTPRVSTSFNTLDQQGIDSSSRDNSITDTPTKNGELSSSSLEKDYNEAVSSLRDINGDGSCDHSDTRRSAQGNINECNEVQHIAFNVEPEDSITSVNYSTPTYSPIEMLTNDDFPAPPNQQMLEVVIENSRYDSAIKKVDQTEELENKCDTHGKINEILQEKHRNYKQPSTFLATSGNLGSAPSSSTSAYELSKAVDNLYGKSSTPTNCTSYLDHEITSLRSLVSRKKHKKNHNDQSFYVLFYFLLSIVIWTCIVYGIQAVDDKNGNKETEQCNGRYWLCYGIVIIVMSLAMLYFEKGSIKTFTIYFIFNSIILLFIHDIPILCMFERDQCQLFNSVRAGLYLIVAIIMIAVWIIKTRK